MPAPRIGLVLGGGGLTGTAFHAGVVTALDELTGWDARTADLAVGTSAGATSAALLRAGFPPADFVARMTGSPLSAQGTDILGDLGPLRQPDRAERPARRPAAPALIPSILRRPWKYRPGVAAAALLPEGNLAVDAGVSWIGDLFGSWPQQPTWITAVSLEDGARVVFGRHATASVRDAVMASCAIPGYFAPVVIEGQRHVDGGMWSIHNLDLVAGIGLDLVVVSAPMSSADLRARERSTATRAPVRLRLDREIAQVRESGTAVIVVQPDTALRAVLGSSTMKLSRRAPVALATRDYVHRLADSGQLDALVSAGPHG